MTQVASKTSLEGDRAFKQMFDTSMVESATLLPAVLQVLSWIQSTAMTVSSGFVTDAEEQCLED